MRDMKIVINSCFGGFNLSHAAVMRYAEIVGLKLYPEVDDISKKYLGDDLNDPSVMVHYYKVPPQQYKDLQKECEEEDGNYGRINDKDWYFSNYDMQRDDPALIKVVEEMGDSANGRCAELKIVEIPDGTDWEISEYDGLEHVAEKHETWR
jgi:hypothetical protein